MSSREATGPDDARFEIKFVARASDRALLAHWLQLHPAGFLRPHPDRRVHNIYFDTPDYRAFAENLSGVSERTKVRYRWYGSSALPDAGRLELKRKRNRLGWKEVFEVPEAPCAKGDDWSAMRSRLRRSLPARARNLVDANPFPVLLNSYSRSYFATATVEGGQVRATIDVEQQAWDPRLSQGPGTCRRVVLPDEMVVEFKFARAAFARAGDLLQGIPIRVSRNSKYVNGVHAISGT